MTQDCVCVLDPNAPAPVLETLAAYIHKVGNVTFLLCASIEYGAFFVELGIVKHIGDNPWKVSISPQYIFAVAERGEESPIGFRTQ